MRLRCRRATGSEARCAVVINRRDRKLRAELQRKPSTFSSGLDCVAHGALIKNKAHKRLKYKYKVQIHKMVMGLRVAAAGSRIFSPGIKPSHLFSSSILQPSCWRQRNRTLELVCCATNRHTGLTRDLRGAFCAPLRPVQENRSGDVPECLSRRV